MNPPTRIPHSTETPATLLARLRIALVSISDKSPTTARSILDRYYRFLSPAMATHADAGTLPVAVRSHYNKINRCTQSRRFDLVCFYIGRAVLEYYKAVLDEKNKDVCALSKRVAKVELIAAKGLDAFKVEGDIKTGFSLIDTTAPAPEKANASASVPPKK